MSVYVWADVYGEADVNPNVNVFSECVLRKDYDALKEQLRLCNIEQFNTEVALAQAEKLLRDRSCMYVPDMDWQDKRDRFLEQADEDRR